MKAIVNARIVLTDRVENGSILMDGGRIVEVGSFEIPAGTEIIDAGGLYAGPGFIDEHCHGSGIHSAVDDPAAVAADHLRHGTTSITPSTAYSWTMDDFMSCISKCRAAIAEGNTNIIGIHFEGPYVNPKYGAHSEKAWPYSRETCDVIFDAAGKDLLHCTYAPELPFAEDFGAYLAERGVVADVGHTEMSLKDLDRAVKYGAKIVTHLYDAMGCWRGRESIEETGVIQDSAADVALATEGLYYELICDSRGVHVKPANIRLALRTAGEDHIILVTDCTTRLSHNPADYPEDDPRSAPDLNYNDILQLSGSRLTMDAAFRNFIHHTGASVVTAFKAASTNSAKALGVFDRVGSIEAGKQANIVLVDDDYRLKAVYFRGNLVE